MAVEKQITIVTTQLLTTAKSYGIYVYAEMMQMHKMQGNEETNSTVMKMDIWMKDVCINRIAMTNFHYRPKFASEK